MILTGDPYSLGVGVGVTTPISARVVRHGNRSAREAGDAPSLAVFRERLDEAFEQPGLVGSVPAHNRGVELDGPFQPKPFCDAMSTDAEHA